MIKGLKTYLLLLWIISLGASGQLFARIHQPNKAHALQKNTRALVHSNTYTQQDHHNLTFFYSLADEENTLLDSREAEIEEEDEAGKHHKYLENNSIYLLFSKWLHFDTSQTSPFYTNTLSLSCNKLFIVFCVYII